MCGGTGERGHGQTPMSGLSPRVRGNRRQHAPADADERSIPACAGEPRGLHVHRIGWRVYPRVCGGTHKASTAIPVSRGLSPRVRGNQHRWPAAVYRRGSIPACAGEPEPRPGRRIPTRVYPRVCGGTLPARTGNTTDRGLSPRVRGNLDRSRTEEGPHGSIPACAGEPQAVGDAHQGAQVYPRVCGGTLSKAALARRIAGLSPRVRGNPEPGRGGRDGNGSIPACAGEPSARPRTSD